MVRFGIVLKAGALAAVLVAGGLAAGRASAAGPTGWMQGSVTPPAGQKRITAPGGRRGKAARHRHRMKHR